MGSANPQITLLIIGFVILGFFLLAQKGRNERLRNSAFANVSGEKTVSIRTETQPPTFVASVAEGSHSGSVIPYTDATAGIFLKLKRSQRSGMMGKVLFALDARIQLTAEDRGLIEKYALGGNVVYDSAAREKHMGATTGHLEETRHAGTAKTLYRLARASASLALAALSLRITVKGLLDGVHVECKSLDELLGAEKAIVEAAQNLKSYLEIATTFDGREELIEI